LNPVLTLIAFLFALTLLIAVHEYGHYRMAVACKVPVLVFSIGFGKVLYRWRPARPRPGQNTEFVIGALPLGGYIQMLDSREGDVPPEMLPLAFDQQSLKVRAAIVAAGPLANLLLAVVLFTGLAWWGQPQALPILASPVPGSWAEQAGLQGGERVLSVEIDGEPVEDIQRFESLYMLTAKTELNNSAMTWTLRREAGAKHLELRIPSPEELALPSTDNNADMSRWRALGLRGPSTLALIGKIEEGSAAQQAGLKPGDQVIRVDGKLVADAQQLRDWIRAKPMSGDARLREGSQVSSGSNLVATSASNAQIWEIDRDGQKLSLAVQPRWTVLPGQAKSEGVMRVGAIVGAPPATQWVSLGAWEGITQGLGQVKQLTVMTFNLIGKMLTGGASSKHLSGPISIAEQAGQSAQLGWAAYVSFLALISVSLGLLNLLPLPMLDGGHLMYYLWESLTGKPVSVAWQRGLQKVGLALLISIMTLAVFNDLTRLF
jgi:regulator of sigma E protease